MRYTPALEIGLFPFAAMYLLLHAAPLFRIRYEPSIRGGTDWRFFTSEVALFGAYLLFAPSIIEHSIGRVAVTTHLTLHVSFALTDYFAHDFLLGTALIRRHASLARWAVKEGGLLLDTLTHGVAVTLLAMALPTAWVVGLLPISILGFVLISNAYVRRHGPESEPAESEPALEAGA